MSIDQYGPALPDHIVALQWGGGGRIDFYARVARSILPQNDHIFSLRPECAMNNTFIDTFGARIGGFVIPKSVIDVL